MSRGKLTFRKIVVLVIALVVTGLLFHWFRSGRIAYANFPPAARGPWVAFGDSLTEGFGASPGHDYPTVLGQRLGLKIINLGSAGDTTADALKRIGDVTKLNPRVVLLCLGGNDGLQQLSRAQMFANLGAIIDQLQQRGAFVVLIGIRSTTVRDKNASYFKKLAREKRVLYVPDLMDGILLHPELMSDQVHPNDEGYAFFAARLEKELSPLMEKLR